MSFTHLHAHTEASIADGLFGVSKWVKALKEKGFIAHAITDHGTLTNVLPFYKQMKSEKMIPILGCEFYFTDDPRIKTKETRRSAHIVLLAKNYDGFRNIMKLSKLSYTDGFYFRPRIGMEWLKEYHEGIVVSSACIGGVLAQQLWHEKDKAEGEEVAPFVGLEKRYDQLVNIFGKDFYVEFQPHKGEEQRFINEQLYERLRTRKGFQPIVTNDCHYIAPEHAQIQGLLKNMTYKTDASGESYSVCDSLWLKKPVQVYGSMKEYHEYLPSKFVGQGMANTQEILEKCKDLEFPKRHYLPKFKSKSELTTAEIFKRLTETSLKSFLKSDRLRADRKVYIQRFKKEYDVITKYGLQDYFLIVWDILRFARSKGIYTGIGRGSAAGCLISYLLNIVKIDPIEYKLIFERFLNANRCESGELPDIDLDIESERRQEVKDYIFDKYGRKNVCEIGTYGRMKLKTCLLDFGMAMKIADKKALHKITTAFDLDKEDEDNLDAAASADPKLARLIKDNADYAFVVRETIGQIKSQSIHPAGVLICSDPIEDITPLKTQKVAKLKGEKSGDRVLTTQCEDKYVVAQGLMKVDVLGLKEYDIIRSVLAATGSDMSEEDYVQRIMDLERDKPDQEVWKYFQEGKTSGVFQFGSDGMKELLRDMKPTHINDLIAANALFRPGCLKNGWHTQYCRRKRGDEAVSFPHKDLEAALGDTYGVIVYQEQFMEAFHRLGGISMIDSDTIRSALGKKDKDKLDKFKAQFVSGAAKKIGEDKANELWDQVEKAAGYTFNKSHSAVYSVLAYISQYLKTHHPAHFWAAQLEWDTRKNKMDDVVEDRKSAMAMGVGVTTPNINLSKSGFSVIKRKKKSDSELEPSDLGIVKGDPKWNVIWSFRGIKGIGEKTAKAVEAGAPYESVADFYDRVKRKAVKFNNMVNLAYAGAFDQFGDRKEVMRELHRLKKKDYEPVSEDDLMHGYYDAIGFFERKLKKTRKFSKSCITEQDLRDTPPGEYVVVGGMISEIKTIKTKRGDQMGFVTIVDLDESLELTLFPTQWSSFRGLLHKGRIIQCKGVKSGFNDKQNVVEAQELEEK